MTHLARLLAVPVLVLACAPSAWANSPGISNPEARAWLYADRLAKQGADWMFPNAREPLAVVGNSPPCDRQPDGSFLCAVDATMYSSGHWHSKPPRTVETWTCAGPFLIAVKRSRSGRVVTTSNDNPCRPDRAAACEEARLLFVAAVHRREGRLGRVSDVHCKLLDALEGPSFHLYAKTTRVSRVRGDVLPDGTTQIGAL